MPVSSPERPDGRPRPRPGAHALRRGTLADGLAMSIAAGGASVVGAVSWVIAARALTPVELGTATAFVSAFLLVAGVTDLNLGVGLLRWLPRAGGAAAALTARAAITVLGLAGVGGALYLLLPEASLIVDAAAGPGGGAGERWVGAAVFVLAAMLWAVFQQQDFVLVGLGSGWWAPARTGVFALARLGILIGAGGALTTTGVVASWVLPTAMCVLLAAVQTRRLVARAAARPRAMPPRDEVVEYLGPTYVGQIAQSVLYMLVPLLVTFRYGPAVGAAFFLAWQAVTVVDVVAKYFVSALTAGVARTPHRAAELSRRTLRRLMAIMLPALALGALIAPGLLSLFGPAYVGVAPVLQIMLGGLVLRLVVAHRLGEHLAMGRSVRFARLALVNTALVVAVAAVAPAGPGGPLLTVAVGFVAVQAVCAAAVAVRRVTDGRAGRPTSDGAERTASTTSTTGDGPDREEPAP